MKQVCVFLAEGFEEIEALTVVDILRRAQIPVDMVSVADGLEVAGAHGIVVKADKRFGEVAFEQVEMIVLPGGMPGTANLAAHTGLTEQIRAFDREGKRIAAICAAPCILGDLGLLAGKKAICYPGMEERLKGAEVVKKRAVADGHIITGRAPGAAMVFALELVSALKGEALAEQLKGDLVYGHKANQNE